MRALFSLSAVSSAFIASSAFAQDAAAAGAAPSPIAGLLPLLLVFAVMYMLIVRPQQKRLRTHESMIKSVKKGDHVLTGGGIVGKVVRADEELLVVEIASGVEVKVARATIANVLDKDGKPIQPQPQSAGKNDNVTASGKPVANDN